VKKIASIFIIIIAIMIALSSCGGNDNLPSDNEGNETPAHAHEYTACYVIKNPTCTENGESMWYCPCGEMKSEIVAMLGHTPETSVIVVDPTYDADGAYYEEVTCATCNIKISETTNKIPMLKHTPAEAVIENKIDATCYSEGSYDNVVYCSECGEELEREKRIIGIITHTEVTIPAVDATCSSTGLTEGKKCSVCSEVIVEQSPVTRLAHNYENKVCTVCGQEYYSEGLAFTSNGDGTCYVSGIGSCTDTDLVIPSISPDGDSVTGIGESAFRSKQALTSVVIPDSVVTIGYNSFACCYYLKSVKIGNGVITIEKSAFDVCTSLSNLEIGSSVTSIGERAFYECGKLQSVIIPDSVEIIDTNTFAYCKALSKVTFGAKLESIGSYAFAGCLKLTNIVLPDSLTTVSSGAFSGCKLLRSVTLGTNVKRIESYAFDGCEKLAEVINKSTIYVSKGSSDHGSIAYNAIEVHKGESKIKYVNGYVFYNLDGVNHLLGYDGDDTDLILPESYNGENYSIYDEAFADMTNLTSVVISGRVDNVGFAAFRRCTNLVSVKISNGITKISNNMFSGCSKLSTIIISDSVTAIGSNAFEYCSSGLNIYYTGSKQSWKAINIAYSNLNLNSATIHYNYVI
jgi:hypothetical protein